MQAQGRGFLNLTACSTLTPRSICCRMLFRLLLDFYTAFARPVNLKYVKGCLRIPEGKKTSPGIEPGTKTLGGSHANPLHHEVFRIVVTNQTTSILKIIPEEAHRAPHRELALPGRIELPAS
jgi:hypothetical protein